MTNQSTESDAYAKLGASSSKAGVHEALGHSGRSPFFCSLNDDAAGSPDHYSLLHADGAGTKSIIAYLAYKESGDPSYFRGIAADSLYMNLDDVACVGAFDGLTLSNTIGRSRFTVPDEVVRELIQGYRSEVDTLTRHGISVAASGGETADIGDLVRTVVVDSTLFARLLRSRAISMDRISPGDVIIGLSSTGQATWETSENSGIGSNGITLARHALISSDYAKKYPEIKDPDVADDAAYRGPFHLFDQIPELGGTLVSALLSPTRTYAPILKALVTELGNEIHGIIHCTGGGQTKLLKYGPEAVRYVKDNLFPCPPIFELIQKHGNVPWAEMYSVFNMGHRMEIICSPRYAGVVLDASRERGVDARVVGRVEGTSETVSLTIRSPHGEFRYE